MSAYVAGRESAYLEGLNAAQRDAVWITTAGAIADHCLALPVGVVPGG